MAIETPTSRIQGISILKENWRLTFPQILARIPDLTLHDLMEHAVFNADPLGKYDHGDPYFQNLQRTNVQHWINELYGVDSELASRLDDELNPDTIEDDNA